MSVVELSFAVVLFDSDGVLVDSDASVTRAWRRWAAEYGLNADRVVAAVHGRRAADSVTALLDAPIREEALRAINAYELEDAASGTAIPGARELTVSMPPGSWAVVTSGVLALARARLEAAGIALPAVLVSADDVPQGKPAPDGYAAAARALGVRPGDAVVVEDAVSGVQAARAAGAGAVLGVGQRAQEADVDVVVDDLRAVTWTGRGLRVAAPSSPGPRRNAP